MDLEFEGTPAQRSAQVETAVRELWWSVKGNGKDGLEDDVQAVSTRLTIIETQNNTLISLGKAIAGLLTLLLLGLGTYFTSLEVRGKIAILNPRSMPNATSTITSHRSLVSR